MAQQDFTGKFWPIANANASEVVPGAAILQTRNGLDEPITLAGNMVFDSVSGLWVPVSEANPLPTKATLTGQRATEVLLHNATQADDPGTVVELNGTPFVLLDVHQCIRADLTVQVRYDDGDWQTVATQSMHTGTRAERIDAPGIYAVKTAGWDELRAVATCRPAGTVTAYARLLQSPPEIIVRDTPSWRPLRPNPYRPESALFRNTNSGAPAAAPWLPEGVIYGHSGSSIRKSTDNGETFSNLKSLDGGVNVQGVYALPNGMILVPTNDGRVYRYDEDTDTLEEVFDTGGGSNRRASADLQSIQVFENYVLFAEYGPNNVADNPRFVYLSDNYGAPDSWQTIFEGPVNAEAPAPNSWHMHGAIYDPYRHVVWVVNGDTPPNSNVWWTRFGEWDNWRKVYEDGQCPNQWTTVYALPNCVLFGSDNFHTGYWRYVPPARGMSDEEKVHLEPAFIVDRHFNGLEPIAVRGLVTYGKNAALYFGFSIRRDDTVSPPIIYGTADGYNFYPVWIGPETTTNSVNVYCGINGISGITADGWVVAGWIHRPEGQSTPTNLIRFKEPEWVPF